MKKLIYTFIVAAAIIGINSNSVQANQTVQGYVIQDSKIQDSTIQDVKDQYNNSVIRVQNSYYNTITSNGTTGSFTVTNNGSGFFITNDLIITNYHVVSTPSDSKNHITEQEINIRFYKTGEKSYLPPSYPYVTELLAVDIDNDLALLKVKDNEDLSSVLKRSQPLKVSRLYDAKINDYFKIVGFPDIEFNRQLTTTISQFTGQTSITAVDEEGKYLYPKVMSFDSQSYKGNSGGPILNANNEVVSVLTYGSQKKPISYGIKQQELINFINKNVPGIIDREATKK